MPKRLRATSECRVARVRPFVDRGYYWRVMWFDTERAMYRYCRRNGTTGSNYAAICRPFRRTYYTRDGASRKLPVLGELVFTVLSFTGGTTAHECIHAALSTLRALKLSCEVESEPDPRRAAREQLKLGRLGNKYGTDEERLAAIAGRLVSECVEAAIRVGVFNDPRKVHTMLGDPKERRRR